MPQNTEFHHFLAKARDAAKGGKRAWDVQSTGEKLAVAMALNRHDWLASMDYTMGEAVDRIGQEWLQHLPQVERTLRDEGYEHRTQG